MSDRYNIALNFLPASGDLSFVVHRKAVASEGEQRPSGDVSAFRTPHLVEDKPEWQRDWISFTPRDGYEEFEIQPDMNIDLTRRAMFYGLIKSATDALQAREYLKPANDFVSALAFVMQEHAEGHTLLEVQPYYLKALRRFGFLVDFHFKLREGQAFSRRVQQLSLSLDRNYRRNLDYYVDRWTRIASFIKTRQKVFDDICLPGRTTPITVDNTFNQVPATRLQSRVYVFRDDKESKSQFSGLKAHGPLQPVADTPHLLFAFREQDRPAARRLAAALKGSRERGKFNFPGFQTLFKTDLEIDPDPIVLNDLSAESMRKALTRAKAVRLSHAGTLPVLVLPDEEENGYLEQKAIFSHAEMPSQVCTLRVLQDDDALRWSVANLALQIFCKAGGYPWKVRPTLERSLIVGISQSHKVRKDGDQTVVEKYFAFSVLTDSSGLFQKMQVLGEGTEQVHYLQKLRETLAAMLKESAQTYASVVIHTSFKLKHAEMIAIRETVQEAVTAGSSQCRFAVIKINHKSRFFGVNAAVNSLVPFEATTIALGGGEYLVWFEGIFPDKPTVSKAFPGPTHVQFQRVGESSLDSAQERELLQDLVNVSGANWRGFNAKSAPVSIFYCHLVADLVRDFHERGLPLPAVHDIRPWFL